MSYNENEYKDMPEQQINIKPYLGLDVGTISLRAALCKEGEKDPLVQVDSSCDLSLLVENPENPDKAGRRLFSAGTNYVLTGVKQNLGVRESLTLYKENDEIKLFDFLTDKIKKLKEETEAANNHLFGGAVIALPPFYTDKQRSLLIDAAKGAGLPTVRLVNDTLAALLGSPFIENADNILVVNIGAGTTSFSAFRNIRNKPMALSHGGISGMGGRSFDHLLAEEILSKLGIDSSSLSHRGVKYLLRVAEKIRNDLSLQNKISVNISAKHFGLEVFSDKSAVKNFQYDRSEFEKLISPLVKEIITKSQQIVKEGFANGTVDKIVFSGKTCLTPLIIENFCNQYGEKSLQLSDDAVVKGAAVFGSSLPDPVSELKKTDPAPAGKDEIKKEADKPEQRLRSWNDIFKDQFNSAESDWKSGKRHEAINGITELHGSLSKFLANLLWSFGKDYYNAGRVDDAISIYKHAIENIYPKDKSLHESLIEALNYKASQLYKEGQIDGALSILKQALGLSPENPMLISNIISVYIRKAQDYSERGQIDLAIRVAEEALRIHPGDNNVNQALHRLYKFKATQALNKRNLNAATKNLKKALMYDGQDQESLQLLQHIRKFRRK